MSLKSTICIPNEIYPNASHGTDIGFVGISSLDHFVYVYQLKRKYSHSPPTLVIYRVNPLVPSSWNVFKEIELDKNFDCVLSTFNAACTKMAFRLDFLTPAAQNEFLLLDMNNGEIEKRLVVDKLAGHYLLHQFAETSVGWVEVSLSVGHTVSCYKTFPVPGKNRILTTFADNMNIYGWSQGKIAGLTYDSFVYISFSNSPEYPWKLCKLVSYDFSSENSSEIAFDQWNSSIHPSGPILITNSNQSYLIRPSDDLGNQIYLVEHDHLGIKLTYLNQLDDQFISQYHPHGMFTVDNNKIAMIHRGALVSSNTNYFLTITNVTVPSLKSLAVWAIQNQCGTFGNDGELLGGISEEKLKKMIKYQGNNKLF